MNTLIRTLRAVVQSLRVFHWHLSFALSCRVTIIRVHGSRLRVLTAVIPPRSREKTSRFTWRRSALQRPSPAASGTLGVNMWWVLPFFWTFLFCWLQSKPSSCNFPTLNKESQGYPYKRRCTVNTFWNYLCGSRLEIFPTNLPETIVQNLLTWESASLLNVIYTQMSRKWSSLLRQTITSFLLVKGWKYPD